MASKCSTKASTPILIFISWAQVGFTSLTAMAALGAEDTAPPLRYIDVYGTPGIGKPANSESTTTNDSKKEEVPSGSATGTPSTTDTLPPFLGEKTESTKEESAETKKGGKARTQEKKPQAGQKSKEKEPVAELATKQVDPLREVLFQVSVKEYAKALSEIDKVLATNPNHPQAHYLKAVINVLLRRYPDAEVEYRTVLRLLPNSDLARRATQGLARLNQ